MSDALKIALIGLAVTVIGWFVKHLLSRRKPPKSDKDILRFFLSCFDRTAFKTPMQPCQENFIKAIEDTITAINTGKLIHREDRTPLVEGGSRHQLSKSSWSREMAKIESILREIRDICRESIESGDPDAAKRIDQLKNKALEKFVSICKQAGVETHISPNKDA